MKRLLKYGSIAVLLGLAACTLYILTLEPRTDRIWEDSLSRSTYITQNDGGYVLHNVRDWTYGPETILSQDWIDSMSVSATDITRVWFLLEPFSDWDRVGHTFITFEFADGNNLSFSVEARRESDEVYSAFQGLFRAFELSYTWGTERDLLTRRLLHLNHDVRMYHLTIEPEVAQTIFASLVERTNDIYQNPRFYNTLSENCTNVLAREMNIAYPQSVPKDISWYLPGTSDTFLMSEGFIEVKGTPEEMIGKHNLQNYRDTIVSIATSSPQVFSANVRSLLISSD